MIIENKTKNKFFETGNIIIHHTASKGGGKMSSYNVLHKRKYYDAYPKNAQPIGRSEDGNSLFEYPYIAYHYLIQQNGKKYQNRNIYQVGYQCGNYKMNCESVAICLDGNFELENPTEEQLKELKKLLIYLRETIGKDLKLFGHRDIMPTACPGNNLYKLIKGIEEEINNGGGVEKGKYEKIFYEEIGESSIYTDLDGAIKTLVDSGHIDREYFFFTLIGLERAKN